MEWIAYCFTCESVLEKGKLAMKVEGSAKNHKRKHDLHHPVIVGYIIPSQLEKSEKPPILDAMTEEFGAVYVPLNSEEGETE